MAVIYSLGPITSAALDLVRVKLSQIWLSLYKKYKRLEDQINIIRLIWKSIFIIYLFYTMNIDNFIYNYCQT
jgi:hypothetical protein